MKGVLQQCSRGPGVFCAHSVRKFQCRPHRVFGGMHIGKGKLRQQKIIPQAEMFGTMPQWTLDQIAGLVFGGVLVASYYGAWIVDAYVARTQRRDLGICEECGGIYGPNDCEKRACPSKNN